MIDDAARRQAIVSEILADPPVVHPMDRSAAPRMGVWATDDSCYRFIADQCPSGARTLETGVGLSTVLFAALGADHICCTAGQDEADRVSAHCDARGIPAGGVRFEVGSSHQTLPRLEAARVERDLVLIDGGHGFPLPIIDWFYAGSLLRAGGVLVVDDLTLPAVAVLADFLDKDPRWTAVDGDQKWRAWRRQRGGELAEDWFEQPFYRTPLPFHLKVLGRIRREVRTRLHRRSP